MLLYIFLFHVCFYIKVFVIKPKHLSMKILIFPNFYFKVTDVEIYFFCKIRHTFSFNIMLVRRRQRLHLKEYGRKNKYYDSKMCGWFYIPLSINLLNFCSLCICYCLSIICLFLWFAFISVLLCPFIIYLSAHYLLISVMYSPRHLFIVYIPYLSLSFLLADLSSISDKLSDCHTFMTTFSWTSWLCFN